MIINVWKSRIAGFSEVQRVFRDESRKRFRLSVLILKVSEMPPNIDVVINIYVATATVNIFGLIIDDESILILFILCVASVVVLCSVVVASLQLYRMMMLLFTVASKLYRVISFPSFRYVTFSCFIFSSVSSIYRSWKLFFLVF